MSRGSVVALVLTLAIDRLVAAIDRLVAPIDRLVAAIDRRYLCPNDFPIFVLLFFGLKIIFNCIKKHEMKINK